jgi:hypothetical protein
MLPGRAESGPGIELADRSEDGVLQFDFGNIDGGVRPGSDRQRWIAVGGFLLFSVSCPRFNLW